MHAAAAKFDPVAEYRARERLWEFISNFSRAGFGAVTDPTLLSHFGKLREEVTEAIVIPPNQQPDFLPNCAADVGTYILHINFITFA